MFEGYVGVEIKIWKMMGSFGEKQEFLNCKSDGNSIFDLLDH